MRNARGFTLLEVLLALAILGVAVVASIQGFAQGLRLLKVAGDHQYAVLLADHMIRDIVTPTEGRKEGEEKQGGTTFAWEMVTTPIEAPDLLPTVPGAPTPTIVAPATGPIATATPQWLVYQIGVRVRWGEHRQVEVTTIRTTPLTPQGTTGTAGPGTSPVPGGAGFPGATTTPRQ